ncbi:sugar ABC transporter substrate-binding protein, partial [Isoptericola sp. NPDC060257]
MMGDLTPRARRPWRAVPAAVAASSLLLLAACSGESEEGGAGLDNTEASMTDFAADQQFKATEPVDFSILWTDWPELPIKDSWQLFDEIEKRTNVTLQPTNIPFSDATEKRSLLISAGDAPQIIPLVYTGEDAPFVSSGAVLPMSDYVDLMPNFQKYVEEWDLGDMIDNLRQDDGKYYMVPGLQEVSVPVFSMIIRKDLKEFTVCGVFAASIAKLMSPALVFSAKV